MTDYFLIELVTFIVISLVSFFLGMEQDSEDLRTWYKAVIWFTISMIFSFMTSLLILATQEAFSESTFMGFVFFGMLSFIFVIVHSWDSYRQYRKGKDDERWDTSLPL
jgi:predicted ferric reductase